MIPSPQPTAFEVERRMAHVPVLTQELLEIMEVRADDRVVDCTFGAGGHASAVAELLSSEGMLIVCDRDPVAQECFDNLVETWSCRAAFYPGNFADTLSQLNRVGIPATHVYMDLGLSSMQVDTEERGFSYSYDAPLDMRMDSSGGLTAARILNEWDEDELGRILREYGEERYARRIARAVVRRRAKRTYSRTAELVDTVKSAIPTPARFGSRNPARRVFQALRIAVNDELGSLRRALPEAVSLLESGGVLAVISFHSLEDRIVKEFFASQAEPCTCPPDFPICACGNEPSLEILTRKPVLPAEREVEMNPRSSSAKLRAARRL